ncbi:MAG: Mur ligase family protein [Solirubrobacterales bacterium]
MFDAEAYLNSLEAIGWKLGLERMELLSEQLGRPQDSYDTIHVVGTNGKSSVTRMCAALLEAHGNKAGCSLSPHLERWSERVMVSGTEIGAGAFAAAVERTSRAAATVDASLGEGDVTTQFEIATAAAFVALADAGVEVAVVEAGLGGRLDATNTINSKVTVLTSIGLDHTEWLGETELEIAKEKLAVLKPGSKLVHGPLTVEVEALAREHAEGLGCEIIAVKCDGRRDVEMASPGRFQLDNFEVAVAAVEALIGELNQSAVREVARSVSIPGRLERIADNPPVYVDVAHNRPGAAALGASIPEIAAGRPVVLVLATLEDKDASGMLAELEGSIDMAILTELPQDLLHSWGRPGARTFPASDLESIMRQLGVPSEVEPEPMNALSRAVSLAEERGGIVLVAGSHYLLSSVDIG